MVIRRRAVQLHLDRCNKGNEDGCSCEDMHEKVWESIGWKIQYDVSN